MRVKTGIVRRRRHKKVLKAAKGYRMSRSTLYKTANQAYMHAGQYSYNDRRKRKGQMRRIWIDRISAAASINGTSYSRLMESLTKAGVELNRKMLSEIAFHNPEVFSKIVQSL